MGRSPCCKKAGLKKGPWTAEEDQKLLSYIQEHGHGSWRALPPKAGLQRCGKSCRLRWTNYLRPDIKRGKFSLQEEQTIIQLHALLGNRWSAIATHLPKRTDNEIKNYWNSHLKKRLAKMGIDPVTHKPKNHALGCGQPKDAANLSHMAQWESARLEAEARLVRESRLISIPYHSQLLTKALPSAPPLHSPCLDVLKVWKGICPKPKIDISTPRANNVVSSFPSALVLNFSENMVTDPNVGLVHENSSTGDINYAVNPMGKPNCRNYPDEVKGTMGNSIELHDVTDSTYVDDSLRFAGFMEGFYTDLLPTNTGISDVNNVIGAGCGEVLEESKISYWGNILNVPSSPMGSSVF